MTSPTSIQLSALASSLKAISVKVPDSFQAEMDLVANLRVNESDRANRSAAASKAMADAETPQEFEKAWNDAAKTLSVDAAKFDPGFRGITAEIISSRARHALTQAAPGLQATLVESMNSIVDKYDLNGNAKKLPPLGEPFFLPTGMSSTQLDALKMWNEASEALTKYWKVFVRVANISSHTLGSPSESSANIRLCYTIADVIEQDPLASMSDMFASWKVGSTSAKRYGNLFPFLIPPSHGVPLKFQTTFEAEALAEALPYIDQR